MASQFKKTRTITDKVSVKGMLSEDGTTITYLDEDKNEQGITVAECLEMFKDCPIDFSVIRKTEDDLNDDEE